MSCYRATERGPAPVPVVEARWNRRGFRRYFDLAPDGGRFLSVSGRPTTEFVVIQDWVEELRQPLPAGR